MNAILVPIIKILVAWKDAQSIKEEVQLKEERKIRGSGKFFMIAINIGKRKRGDSESRKRTARFAMRGSRREIWLPANSLIVRDAIKRNNNINRKSNTGENRL